MSLYRAFKQVSDHRQKRGVRYPLAFVLSLVVLGKLAWMTTLAGIAEWVRLRADWLKEVLPFTRTSLPCASTYGNVLRTLEAEEVTRLMAEWLTRLSAMRRCGAEPSRLLTGPEAREQHIQVALDGKTLRGTLGHAAPDQQSCHLVALYETQTGVVLAQHAVPDKGNEITLEATLLIPTQVHGRIVTADAMHTQRTCCADISRFGGDYVLLAKANQPTLEEDLRLFFAEPPVDCRDWRQTRTCSKGHGRLEIRELLASTELNEWLAASWPGVEQVFCLRRTVSRQGQMHTQTIYGITTLSPKQASAARLLEVVRRHWAIEIVSSQMTKTKVFTAGGGGDHVTDLHLLVGDDDTINEQFNQLPFLLKGGLRQSILHSRAKRFDRLDQWLPTRPGGPHWPPTGALVRQWLAGAGPTPGDGAGTPPTPAPWPGRHLPTVPAAVPHSRAPCADFRGALAILGATTARLGPAGGQSAIRCRMGQHVTNITPHQPDPAARRESSVLEHFSSRRVARDGCLP